MFDFFKPVMDLVRGGGGQQTETTRKTTPPDVKAKPEEKKGANGLGGLVSGLFKGLFDDLGSMGEDPTEDVDSSTKSKGEATGKEKDAAKAKTPEEAASKTDTPPMSAEAIAKRAGEVKTAAEVRALMAEQVKAGVKPGDGIDPALVTRARQQQDMIDQLSEMQKDMLADGDAQTIADEHRRLRDLDGREVKKEDGTTERKGFATLEEMQSLEGKQREWCAKQNPPVDFNKMPASERLLRMGFSPEEIANHFTPRDHDADASMKTETKADTDKREQQRQELQDKRKQWLETNPGKGESDVPPDLKDAPPNFDPLPAGTRPFGSNANTDGTERQAMSEEQKRASVQINSALMQTGDSEWRKMVGTGTLDGRVFNKEAGQLKVSGDHGDASNSTGNTAQETVHEFGMDWSGSYATKHDKETGTPSDWADNMKGGAVDPTGKTAAGVEFLQGQYDTAHGQQTSVPLGKDLHDQASSDATRLYDEQKRRATAREQWEKDYETQHGKKPDPKDCPADMKAIFVPTMLQVDPVKMEEARAAGAETVGHGTASRNDVFPHLEERSRGVNASDGVALRRPGEDPKTGLGYSASEVLLDQAKGVGVEGIGQERTMGLVSAGKDTQVILQTPDGKEIQVAALVKEVGADGKEREVMRCTLPDTPEYAELRKHYAARGLKLQGGADMNPPAPV